MVKYNHTSRILTHTLLIIITYFTSLFFRSAPDKNKLALNYKQKGLRIFYYWTYF